jgi:hypothetical protein
MTEKEYNICIGKILAGKALDESTAQSFVCTLSQFEQLLDDGDQDDYFGTEGWRHRIWD